MKFEAAATETEKEVDFETIRREALDFLFSHEHDDFFIDKGGVGKVYELPCGFCIKILDERHTHPEREKFDLGNHPELEARIQNRLSHSTHKGRGRAPIMFAVISSERSGERNAIIMERLNAVNLEHIVKNPKLLPEKFDINDFFDELERFVEHMHKVDHVAHNDLFARNIMVDLETAEPRVIDFGRSEDLRLITDEKTKRKFIESDWNKLDEVYEEVREALESLQD